jgi:hypothetical protein
VLHTYTQLKRSLGKRRKEEKEGKGKANEGREASAKRDATLLNAKSKEKQESNSS